MLLFYDSLYECEYIKVIYLNRGLKNEDVSDYRSYEQLK